MRTRILLAVACLAGLAATAPAHFTMLLPQTASAKKGQAVTFTYQWGHPFEHQLSDAQAPESVIALGPDGKKTDLKKTLTKVTLPGTEGKKVTAYQFQFTPEQRGDYVFVLTTPPIWMAEDEELVQDTVKVVLHVQAQKGWDGAVRPEAEFVPLTRPYGLRAGMVYQAQLRHWTVPPVKLEPGQLPKPPDLKDLRNRLLGPLPGALVEIERYNATPPKEVPPDEFVTRAAKTDPNGVVTCTLPEAGWWCLASARDGGKKERGGKRYPLKQRSILWVYVDDKPAGK
jgi:cobalt/nickel transport protein